jgi:hypothetical protein
MQILTRTRWGWREMNRHIQRCLNSSRSSLLRLRMEAAYKCSRRTGQQREGMLKNLQLL